MFIPTFCPDECPLVVLKSEGCWGQLNHQNMPAELEDWWERYCWRGKFQKTSQGARHVWWGGRTSPYLQVCGRVSKESYRCHICPVITCDHISWHYWHCCNKFIAENYRKLPFPAARNGIVRFFFPTAEKTSLFWGPPPGLETYRGARGDGTGQQKIQLVNLLNASKCVENPAEMHHSWNSIYIYI